MKAATKARELLVRFARAWNDFWFAPADPTTLGLIRILAGFLVLYAHIAYSWDLDEFMGRDAWLSLAGANLQRHQTPRSFPPPGWEPKLPSLPGLPTNREERAAVLEYFRKLAEHPEDRDRVVLLLNQPALPDDDAWGLARPPGFFLALPADPPESELPQTDPNYVAPRGRGRVVQFIKGLPANAAERAALLEYMKEWGVDPRQVERGAYVWSVWFHVTDPAWMAFVHCLVLLVMFLFMIGFCTRITAVLSWLGALSYIHRAPNVFFGFDAMMMVTLLYLVTAPSGAALSVDRLIARWWKERKARRAGQPPPEETAPEPMISANFALRLLQIQFCIIYLAAGTSKLLGGRWWNGHALYYTIANYEFSPVRHDYFYHMLSWLCQHRWLWEMAMTAGSWFTIALELSLPMLVWNRRLRMPLVACAVILHASIALTMGLVVFSLMMGTMVLAFVPGESVRAFFAWCRSKMQKSAKPATEKDEHEDRPTKKSEKHGRARHGSRR